MPCKQGIQCSPEQWLFDSPVQVGHIERLVRLRNAHRPRRTTRWPAGAALIGSRIVNEDLGGASTQGFVGWLLVGCVGGCRFRFGWCWHGGPIPDKRSDESGMGFFFSGPAATGGQTKRSAHSFQAVLSASLTNGGSTRFVRDPRQRQQPQRRPRRRRQRPRGTHAVTSLLLHLHHHRHLVDSQHRLNQQQQLLLLLPTCI